MIFFIYRLCKNKQFEFANAMASLAPVNTKHATSPWLPSVKLDHIF